MSTIYEVISREVLSPLATGNTSMCDWRLQPADKIVVHLVLRKHVSSTLQFCNYEAGAFVSDNLEIPYHIIYRERVNQNLNSLHSEKTLLICEELIQFQRHAARTVTVFVYCAYIAIVFNCTQSKLCIYVSITMYDSWHDVFHCIRIINCVLFKLHRIICFIYENIWWNTFSSFS